MGWTVGQLPTRFTGTANPLTSAQALLMGEAVFGLMIKARGAADRTGGAPTWNGRTFTQVGTTQKAAASPEASAELWVLLNETPGSGLISIPNAGSLTLHVQPAMLKAGSRVCSLGQSFTGNGTSTNPTPGTAPSALPDVAAFLSIAVSGATNFSPAVPTSANATLITANDDGADGGATLYSVSQSMGGDDLGFTFGTSDDWGCVAGMFLEESINLNNYKHVRADSGISVAERTR
jgi:hypothetical protein